MACTTGYCRLILAGCDVSSIIMACHEGASPLLKEEMQRDLLNNPQLAAAELVPARWRMCHPIIN
jgi:hypothetical protein